MKRIPLDAKILNITHVDLDGCGCSIVLGNVFKNITYVFSSFYNIDEKLEIINYDEYDYVILTDIHPTEKKYLNISDKIILIDHHPSDLNNPKKLKFVVSDKDVCATILVKYFIEKMYDIKLSHLDNLTKLINDYDMWHLKYPKSKQMNDLMFYKYRPSKFRNKFMNGRVEFIKEEIEFLKLLNEKFKKTYNEMEVIEFDTINACVIFESDFINEIADKLIKEENYGLVVIKHPQKGRCSLRTGSDDVDIGQVLSDFGWGGGHPKSAGIFVKNDMEFHNKMETLERHLYSKYKTLRKQK